MAEAAPRRAPRVEEAASKARPKRWLTSGVAAAAVPEAASSAPGRTAMAEQGAAAAAVERRHRRHGPDVPDLHGCGGSGGGRGGVEHREAMAEAEGAAAAAVEEAASKARAEAMAEAEGAAAAAVEEAASKARAEAMAEAESALEDAQQNATKQVQRGISRTRAHAKARFRALADERDRAKRQDAQWYSQRAKRAATVALASVPVDSESGTGEEALWRSSGLSPSFRRFQLPRVLVAYDGATALK